jgi:indolepyruvate ferredoxin oxidoreductase beta subunit
MKQDILIAGVGGQGILSIATVIGRAALAQGLHLKQSEVHGMAQRGGAVQSHLRLSDAPIRSDLIPMGRVDLVLSMEPLEALRCVAHLQPEGWIVSNQVPVVNMVGYPAQEQVWAEIRARPRSLLFDAVELARQNGSPRSVNMAVLGAAAPLLTVPLSGLEDAIRTQFGSKGEAVVGANLAVFRAAQDLARSEFAARKSP